MSQVEVLGGSLPPLPPGASSRPGASKGWVYGVLAVLAVALLGVVAWRVLFAAASGATTPEQAVENLLQGVADQDGVAVIGAVSSGESAGAQAFEDAVNERLEGLGTTPGDAVAEGLALELGEVDLSTERLSDHAYRVTVDEAVFTGTSDADGEIEFDLADAWEVLPGLAGLYAFGAMDDGYVASDESSSFTSELDIELDEPGAVVSSQGPADDDGWCAYAPDEEEPVEGDMPGCFSDFVDEEGLDENYDDDLAADMPAPAFIVIEEDGSWRVSLVGTVADVVNELADGPAPDFEALSAAVDGERTTASTPDAAITALLEAVSTESATGVLDALPLTQVAGLYPYAGVVQESLEDEGVDVELEVSELTTSELARDGDLLTLGIDSATVELSYTDDHTVEYGDGPDTATMTVDGGCVAFDDEESCLPDRLTELTGIDGFTVTVREVDGGYQVDPVATFFSYLTTAAENLPEDYLRSLLSLAETEPQVVEPGGPTTVTLDALGTATLEVEAQADQVLVVRYDDEDLMVSFADADGQPLFDGSEVSTAWTGLLSPALSARIVSEPGTQRVQVLAGGFLSGSRDVEVEVAVLEAPQVAVGEEVPLQHGDFGIAEVLGAVESETGYLAVPDTAVSSYCYEPDCRTLVVATEPGTVTELADYEDESYEEIPEFDEDQYGIAYPTFADGTVSRSFDLSDGPDSFDLTVEAAGAVVVDSVNGYGELDIVITVYDDEGAEVCYGDAWLSPDSEEGHEQGVVEESCEFMADPARSYTVEISDYDEQTSTEGEVVVSLY